MTISNLKIYIKILLICIIYLIHYDNILAQIKSHKLKQKINKTNTNSKNQYTSELAKEIIKKSENLRSEPQAKIQVTLTTIEDDTKIQYELLIFKSTEQRAYVEFLAPPEEVGRKMLTIKKQYWSSFPDSKKVIPISKKEMIGNSAFAMADLFQIDPDKEYDPSIDKEEICTIKNKKIKCLKLNLIQKSPEVSYYKIEYFVDALTHYPLLSKFYGISNKLLKTMFVEKSANIAGKFRPVTLKMIDNTVKNKISIWETKNLVPMKIPDNVFTKDYLKK